MLTGVIASVFAERLQRTVWQLAEAQRKTSAILEGVSDGFNTFDHEWRYTYVNTAAAKMVGKTREELLGKNLWEMWPQALDSPFGAAYHRALAENVPISVEAFYAEPLNRWFEVRCYPSTEGLTLFFTDTTVRKRTGEQLRLLESAVLQTSDGILIVKVSGEELCRPDPVFVNPALRHLTGFSLEELKNGSLPLLQRACLDPSLMQRPSDGGATKCPAHLEQLAYRKDGSGFWAEFNFMPLADERGNYTHCVWTVRDITERKHAEEAARLLTAIVESSDDAIISKNVDSVILSWNKAAERMYGYSAEEIVGRSISVLVPPDHPGEMPALLERLRVGETIEHYETEQARKDGQRLLVALTISPLRDAAQKITGLSVIARYITERKRAEKALQLSEERYRALAFVTSQIIWTTKANGEVDDMPMWRAFTGQSGDQVRGWGWIDGLHPDDRDRTVDIWSRSVENCSFYNTEYRMRRHDGEYRWMAVHGVPVLEEQGTIREWVGTCADITERKQAEEQIRRMNEDLERRVVERTAQWEASNKELEAFAYSVSHDLRAPLRAIDGFSRILLDEYAPDLPPDGQRYLNTVRKNALDMGQLIDHLLAFSRLSRQPLKKEPIDMAALVRQALEELAREQEGRRIEIGIGDLPPAEADPALLKQVLVNLLANALKYTRQRDPAKIEIGAIAQDGRPGATVYFVRDNGAGFEMQYAAKLFGVFQRLHRVEDYEGTGVGLALVHRIITRHGGRVWAEAALDQGATFYFTLPDPGGTETTKQELRSQPMRA